MKGWLEQGRKLRALLRRRGQSLEDAEDLVQEAFLRLHQFMEAGGTVVRPGPFLARTARNLVVDRLRRHRKEGHDLLVQEAPESLAVIDVSASPEASLSAEQRLTQLEQVLTTRLHPRAREVFLLHRVEGYTHEEIARRLQVSVRTVEKDIARAITLIWIARQEEAVPTESPRASPP